MYRAYVLKHHINRSKLLKIDDIVRAYRVTAKNISDLIWREFYLNSEIKRFYPLKEVGSIMSERYKQVCLNQVLGMINSYLSNRKNEFKSLVYRSSVKDEKLKRDLFYINRYGLWFNNEIGVRSSNGLSDIFLSKQLTLDRLVREFIERHKGFYSNRPAVTANPYFAHVFKETVSIQPNKRIS